MIVARPFQCGLFGLSNGSHCCFFILFCSSLLFAQPDSSHSLTISAGTEYFDLFRQKSEKSSTTAFFRRSFLAGTIAFNMDSITISYHDNTHYASFNQNESKTSFSVTNTEHVLDIQYNGKVSIFHYLLDCGTFLNTRNYLFRYGIGFSVHPWDDLFESRVELHQLPAVINSANLFQDFLVDFKEQPLSTQWIFSLRSKPINKLTGEIIFSELKGTTSVPAVNYGTSSVFTTQSIEASVRFPINNESNLHLAFNSVEHTANIILKRDDISFGSLNNGSVRSNHFEIGTTTELFSQFFLLQYSFDQVKGSGIGHIESWPFTSFAASIIANRLLFSAAGIIKHHSISLIAPFHLQSFHLKVNLSYHNVIPDIVLEHWEPEFLVFGMKNFYRKPFSISIAHLGKIYIAAEIPMSVIQINFFGEQYLPISISYRSYQAVQPIPPSTPVSPTSIATDGGRRFGIQLSTIL